MPLQQIKGAAISETIHKFLNENNIPGINMAPVTRHQM